MLGLSGYCLLLLGYNLLTLSFSLLTLGCSLLSSILGLSERCPVVELQPAEQHNEPERPLPVVGLQHVDFELHLVASERLLVGLGRLPVFPGLDAANTGCDLLSVQELGNQPRRFSCPPSSKRVLEPIVLTPEAPPRTHKPSGRRLTHTILCQSTGFL